MSGTAKYGFWKLIMHAFLAVLAIAGWLGFKAYEPYITGPIGWKQTPESIDSVNSTAATDWAEAGERARSWLEATRNELGAPSVSAAVSIDGEIVWTGVTGYADIDNRIAATPATAFRIGSSSKAVTSIAMGVLIARDAVDLDAPVSAYIPDLAAPLATITTRQAMGHQAGVRDYGSCFCLPVAEYFNRRHFETQRDTLRHYERDALLFEPGTSFLYSSNGYNIAGAVIEAVTGENFTEFLDETVFGPLGMTSSRADTGHPSAGDARFYDTSRPGIYKETFRVDNTIKLPSGGILSTPTDMVRLGQEMLAPTLFDEATRDMLIRPQMLADGSPSPQGYALGWRFGAAVPLGDDITTPRFGHNGAALGSTSYFNIFPEYGMAVSVMANTMGGPRESSVIDRAGALSEMFANAIDERKAALSGGP